MLLGNFYTYTLNSKDDGVISVSIRLVQDHDIYNGHFPDVPVTPGVCQVQMVKEILEQELGKKLQLASARDIKFLSMIDPHKLHDMQLDLTYKISEQGAVQVSGLMVGAGVKYLKLRAEYAELG